LTDLHNICTKCCN